MLKYLVIAAALAGCGGGDGADSGQTTDANPGGDVDSGEGGGGLALEFQANPGLGPFEADLDPTLEAIEITLSNVRAIGDGAPGDERTTLDNLVLRFSEGDNQVVRFSAAPFGRYSRVRARLDSFAISGELELREEEQNWVVTTTPASGIELDISFDAVELAPGGDSTIELRVRLDRPFDEVNWGEFGEGDLQVDDSYEKIEEIREKIVDAFEGEEDDEDRSR